MSKSVLYLYCMGILFISYSSCDSFSQPDVVSDYKYFNLRKNGWKSKRIIHSINKLNYSATEVPLQYYLLRNLDDHSQIDSLYQLSSNERIIEFEFEHDDQNDILLKTKEADNYENAVKYIAFFIEKDFKVVTSSNDTIACAGVHFERNFKIAPFKRILLYFNGIDPKENIELIYNDHLFNNGIIKFNFTETPLLL